MLSLSLYCSVSPDTLQPVYFHLPFHLSDPHTGNVRPDYFDECFICMRNDIRQHAVSMKC